MILNPPAWHQPVIGAVLIGSAGLAPLIVNDYYLAFGLQIFMMLALAQSWNLISGMTGYISFGHAAFFGFGAYTAALIVPLGIPWPWAIICGAGVALILAIPLGLLTLRLRGPYFAIAMLGLNEVARILVTLWVDLTRGGSGISLSPALLPELSATYYCMLLLASASTILIAVVYHSRFGLELRAIRDDEGAAAMIGVNTTRNKFLAFIGSAIIPGAVGAVFTLYTSYINPSSAFAAALNIQMIVMVMLGGSGTTWGPVLGTILAMGLREMLWANFPALHMAALGVLLLVVVLFLPGGLLSLLAAIYPGQSIYTPSPVNRKGQGNGVAESPPSPGRERGPWGGVAESSPSPVRGRGPGGGVAVILQVQKLTRAFGGVQALRNVNLEVAQGTILGIIGPNGSGKTTLFQCISGVDPNALGSVLFAGKSILGLQPHVIYRRGLARTFQLSRVFANLTVLENLLVAAHPHDRETVAYAHELLERVKLHTHVNVLGSALSYGQQKLIEFLRVLMSKPQLILLDEPAAGVNPTLRITLWDMVRYFNNLGVSFVIIEHNMDVIADLCSQVVVLAEGEVIAQGTFQDIRQDERVLAAYFGSA